MEQIRDVLSCLTLQGSIYENISEILNTNPELDGKLTNSIMWEDLSTVEEVLHETLGASFEHTRLGGDKRTDLSLHLPAAPGVPVDPLGEAGES